MTKKVERPEEALFRFASEGDALAVADALMNGANPKERHLRRRGPGELRWETPLMAAAACGHADCLKALLDAGGDAKVRGEARETALHLAVEAGSLRCAQLLLEAGVDPLARDRQGSFPIHWAARGGDVQCLAFMGRFGGWATESRRGMTPLMEAAAAGREEAVVFLLAKGKPGWSSRASGSTALMAAAKAGKAGCVELLAPDSNMGALNDQGWSALFLAAKHAPLGAVAGCVERLARLGGAELARAKDASGLTPLAWAASLERWAAVEALLPWSDPLALDGAGKSVAQWAREPRHAPPGQAKNEGWAQKIELFALSASTANAPALKKGPRL
jgi:ankyrin repeat protein